MERERPWQTDTELESTTRYPGGGPTVSIRYGPPPKPLATWGLLASFGAVFLLELIIRGLYGDAVFFQVFTIYAPERWDWIYRPWSPITATISHHPLAVGHLVFNSIALYFFGPSIEQLLGLRRYLLFFLGAGVVSSIAQAAIDFGPALGASGAIMGLIGMTVVLAPNSKIFLFPIPAPIPLWVAGILFALIDLAGAFSGTSGIGNFAHLAGMAMGLVYGWILRRKISRPRGAYVAP